MTDRDTTPRAIHNAAVAMAGGADAWNSMSTGIREQYIALAELAAPALMGGGALAWDDVEHSVTYVLAQHRSYQTTKKPDELAIQALAMKVVQHFQRCGYTVFRGPPTQPHGGNFPGHRGADE